MTNQTEKKKRKAGKRSPSYPMLSLDEAIEKAKVLWEKDKNNSIPIEAVYEHLGYRSKAGYAARVLAALKKFNLIFEKQDDILLTEEAVDLALHSPTEEHYKETVKKLALSPSIYEKLFNEYNGKLPSDANLRIKLIKDYEFNPESVDDFLTNFRRTIDFAGLSAQAGDDIKVEDVAKVDMSKLLPPKTGKDFVRGSATLVQSFDVPLMEGSKATITFDKYPLEEADVELLKKWFEVYAPAIMKKKKEGNPDS